MKSGDTSRYDPRVIFIHFFNSLHLRYFYRMINKFGKCCYTGVEHRPIPDTQDSCVYSGMSSIRGWSNGCSNLMCAAHMGGRSKGLPFCAIIPIPIIYFQCIPFEEIRLEGPLCPSGRA